MVYGPLRSTLYPSSCGNCPAFIIVQYTATCVETSTTCPSPELRAFQKAHIEPTTACAPAWSSAWGKVILTGARSESPLMYAIPPIAHDTRSVALYPEYGPDSPKGVIEAITSRGLTLLSSSYPSPKESMYFCPDEIIRKSTSEARLFRSCAPSGLRMSRVMPRLLKQYDSQNQLRSGSSWPGSRGQW